MVSPRDVVQFCELDIHRRDKMPSAITRDGLDSRELVNDVLLNSLDSIDSSLISAGHGDQKFGVRADYRQNVLKTEFCRRHLHEIY